MRDLNTASTVVVSALALALAVCAHKQESPAQPGPQLPPPSSPQNSTVTAAHQLYRAVADSWSWAYEGIAHGQYFSANGTRICSMRLRVARLNDSPDAPLDVEVRDRSLKNIYARGKIPASEAEREFRWVTVKLDRSSSLREDDTYVLLFHSEHTNHRSPWLVNEIYRDIYPKGRHLGYDFDLFFEIIYSDGHDLRVGPDASVHTGPVPSHVEI